MYKGVDASRFGFDDGGMLSFGAALSEASGLEEGGGGGGGRDVVFSHSNSINSNSDGNISSKSPSPSTIPSTSTSLPKQLNPDLVSTINPLLQGLIREKGKINASSEA